MEDPKKNIGGQNPGTKGPQGVGVPAKGDSSPSQVPLDPDPFDGATISDVPRKPPTPPTTRVANIDLTLAESIPGATRAAGRSLTGSYVPEVILNPGDVIGARYELLELLGEGGMGAVFKAHDIEIDRFVALKVIRPELARNPAILARFKQELQTAHQVTHKNVIRIYDIAEADGVKFITMEFVDGSDLRRWQLDHGKFTHAQTVDVIRQVCFALDAAHSAGIIHRDLKPQNIMKDNKSGRILVMDFGLARSLESDGMTQTGMLLGTIDYMSPEQAMGKTLDARSDLFTLGLIFYELLSDKMPYKAETAMASLLKRNQDRAVPLTELDLSIPKGLSDIVAKCLERDVERRYQSAAEIVADLDAWEGKRPVAASMMIPAPSAPSSPSVVIAGRRELPWKWIVSAAITFALLVGGGAWMYRGKLASTPKPSAAHAPVSVLVADFTNHTGDPIFDDTLEPMFNLALEGASFINAFNRGEARKLAGQLPHPTDKLDEQPARLVAVSQGIDAVVTGELSRRGDKYSLSATTLDAVSGNVIARNEVTVGNKDEVLLNITKLAAPIRKALGDTTPESVQLEAAGGAFTAASLEAVHQYGLAMKQQFDGNMDAALQSFAKAAELDPNFARAYAGMASAAGNLGQLQDAEKYAKQSMEHVDRMTDRERFRIRGLYYIRTENWQKCVEEYNELLKQYPVDNIGHENLAVCFAALHDVPRAVEQARQAVQIAPKDLIARMNFSLYACYAGDFQTCEREGREVQKLNPSDVDGYLVLAYAQLGAGQLSQATETYQQLQKLGARGSSLAASGLANLALYEGRYRQAREILEKGIAADLAEKQPDRAADHLAMLAYTELMRGDKQSAMVAADKALANSQSTKIRFLAARTYVEAGETAKAQKLSTSLGSEIKTVPQAYAKLILGEAALKAHDPRQALQLLTEAKNLVDNWIVHLDLGLAYLDAGLFVEADSEFQRCLERRGEALELFTDDMPTYSYVAPVYYYLGRAEEGVGSAGAANSYSKFVSIQAKGDGNPLVQDAKKRLAELSARK